MSHDPFAKLDNPAWWALTGVQQSFAIGTKRVKRYQRGILPFAAYDPAAKESIIALDEFLEAGEVFFLIGELPSLPAHWTLLKELPCAQMINQAAVSPPDGEVSIARLTEVHSNDMYNLIQKVQPGYYEHNTRRLGSYYGIWQQDKLVAIAGERMRLEELTEISAICTDPEYTGRKYAQHLIAHLCNTNLDQGNIPFLHVLETNQRAIGLYEYMGFTKRRTISFWQLKKTV
ncbi:GNAT family N-acetyltransferase [Pseudoflavitalea sp. X16]|uniref:GNAT family N-acetyltransferase n=1 Tax=Paraflavitalea devenefica TaxID=2716334 RepID=UPI00141FF4A4|nr:GNAT family N-acetyltransferase [Paraflavitalea devenefica]NII29486.1 GNAT family N-acetyltransferase [Paraflavitalea devenefica]